METEPRNDEKFWQEIEKNHKRGKIFGGILIVIIGSLFLARELGAAIPPWIFSWKMLLIGVGLVMGIKSNFRSPKWIAPFLIGTVLLLSEFYPELAIKPLLWPIIIIIVGLVIIFKPRNKYHHRFRHKCRNQFRNSGYTPQCGNEESTSEDKIDISTFLGAIKKNILSKNFKGGSIKNFLGGSEINLSQADFEGTIILEISNALGGTQLTIPANWEVRSELVSVLGGIEDSRHIPPNQIPDKNKILILRGSVFMGGIEIKSY